MIMKVGWPESLAERPGLGNTKICFDAPGYRERMIMTLQAGERLMSLTDVSEMLGIPVHTLYRWRHKGDCPVGYRVGRHVRCRREAVEAWLEQQVRPSTRVSHV
jgi:excisionase family DNA binding protein